MQTRVKRYRVVAAGDELKILIQTNDSGISASAGSGVPGKMPYPGRHPTGE